MNDRIGSAAALHRFHSRTEKDAKYIELPSVQPVDGSVPFVRKSCWLWLASDNEFRKRNILRCNRTSSLFGFGYLSKPLSCQRYTNNDFIRPFYNGFCNDCLFEIGIQLAPDVMPTIITHANNNRKINFLFWNICIPICSLFSKAIIALEHFSLLRILISRPVDAQISPKIFQFILFWKNGEKLCFQLISWIRFLSQNQWTDEVTVIVISMNFTCHTIPLCGLWMIYTSESNWIECESSTD